MSSAGISFGGLASGLDTQAIISALLDVERVPIRALERTRDSYKRQKSQFGDLSGMLDKLADAAGKLSGNNDLLQFKAGLDTEDYLTATASSQAQAGTYRIEVNQVAQNEVRGSNGFADRDQTAVASLDTLLFDIGGTLEAVALPLDATLDDIANAVNAEDIGITAQVVDTGNGATPFELVFTSDTIGEDGRFSVSVDGNAGTASLVNDIVNPMNAAAIVTGENANVTVNGINYQRTTNTIGDIIQGVTLDLKSDALASGGGPNQTQLTISTDTEATSESVKEFVETYNEIVDFVTGANNLDEDGNATNALFGDVTLRSIRSNMRSIVGSVVNTGNEAFQMLAQIGISSDTEGKLTFNQGEFDEALVEDPNALQALFADQANGIAVRMEQALELYTDSVDGLIKTRQEGFDRLIRQTDDRIEKAETRLDAYETRLINRFASLEQLLTSLQSQGSALSGIQAPA